jgi:hypothetical protein
VPVDAAAYSHLRTLAHANLLPGTTSEARQDLLLPQPTRALTRYDVALLLVEPMEQLTAVVEAQDNLDPAPAQRRRFELGLRTLSTLTIGDINASLTAASALLAEYRDAIEAIAPGLPSRTATALDKLRMPRYRLWQKTVGGLDRPVMPRWRLSSVGSEMWRDPLVPASIMPGFAPDAGAPTTPKTITSYAAAMDVALSSRFRLYTAVAVQPSAETMTVDGGKARLGLEFSLFRIRDYGITGILEYSVTHSAEAGAPTLNSGATGGFGVVW